MNAETCFTAYHAAYSYQKETLRSIAISDEKLEALVFRGCRNFLLSGAPKHVTAAATTPVATGVHIGNGVAETLVIYSPV